MERERPGDQGTREEDGAAMQQQVRTSLSISSNGTNFVQMCHFKMGPQGKIGVKQVRESITGTISCGGKDANKQMNKKNTLELPKDEDEWPIEARPQGPFRSQDEVQCPLQKQLKHQSNK